MKPHYVLYTANMVSNLSEGALRGSASEHERTPLAPAGPRHATPRVTVRWSLQSQHRQKGLQRCLRYRYWYTA